MCKRKSENVLRGKQKEQMQYCHKEQLLTQATGSILVYH